MPPKAPSSTVVPLPRQRGDASRLEPIPGMKGGWYYRPSDRAVLHTPGKDDPPVIVGTAPKVTGVVTHLTDDGEPIRIEYQVTGKRRKKILNEDEIDRGTWAAKLGLPRPSGNDARLAFATVIRRQAENAPEIPARTYYNDAGDLILPDPDAQSFGYLTCAGTEKNARAAWEEIGAWTMLDGNAALALGAVFVGPVLDSLDVLAHIVNLYGPGQQGKSTALTVAAATLGDIKPQRQQLLMTWNASKQGITQGLRMRGYLPLALDEHSSSGRTAQQSSAEFSQIVAGAIRSMGGAEGTVRDIDGFWKSVLLSSSNEPLRWQGQVEALASRLHEIGTPFFPNRWLNAEGIDTDPAGEAAEHLSKRLKRLAKSAGGWPLHWAVQLGMFRAKNLAQIKRRHLELCAKYVPHSGGIPDTIAEHHMAWVVGAEMLGAAIEVPEIGAMAEYAAAQRLQQAIQDAAESNLNDGERLWLALDALRVEASAYPDVADVAKAVHDSYRTVKGFVRDSEWWVLDSVVRQAAREYGVENLMQALRQLDTAGIHVRGDGKNAQRQVPRALWEIKSIPKRLHCFRTDVADTAFGGTQEEISGQGAPTHFQTVPTPVPTLYRPQVGTENLPLTSTVPTVPTVPTFSATDIHTREESTAVGTASRLELEVLEPSTSGPVPTGQEQVGTASQSHDATAYPTPVEKVTDPVWSKLRRDAAGIGVLAIDGLHLPNRFPVQVPLPASVDQAVPLMQAYQLRTLYLHQSVIEALGLPSYEELQAAGVRSGFGTEHAWATPSADSPISAIYPAGLSTWMTLKLGTDPQQMERLNIAIPAYEDRFSKGDEIIAGFGGAKDGATLLDTLMVWTLSTLHYDRQQRARVFPYYRNPNKTAEDLAGGKGEKRAAEVLCHAIRDKQVPPAATGSLVPSIVRASWHRKPTLAERACGYLHQYDKTAAWMGAYSNVLLGIGEPQHATGNLVYNPKWAGYWRVAEVPGHGIEGLPPLQFADAPDGGHWLRTPGMDLLRQLYPEWEPEVVEAWYWPTSRRALNGMYQHLKNSRDYILDAIAAGRPGAKLAKQVNGRLYQSFWGHLGRVSGPKQDFESGGNYDRDIYWRPDWAHSLRELACCNTYRALMGFAESGHYPISVYVDAAAFASDEPDPQLAKPASMLIGDQGGNWTPEGSAPMAALLPLIDDGKTAYEALKAYLKEH